MRKLYLATLALLSALALITAPMSGSARAQDFSTGLTAFEAGDYSTAFGNWWPLAIRGHAKAQASLGLLYYAGQGVKLDTKKSLLWFSRAAEAGQPTAQFFLGLQYFYGRGVKRDYAKAHAWCDIAMTNGYLDSLYCRDAAELEMSPADKKRSEAITTKFNNSHNFRN